MSDKQKKSSYYKQAGRRYNTERIKPGLRGFLCSCNNNDKECLREAYNILNKYYEKQEQQIIQCNEDVEDLLERELQNIKNKDLQTKLFQAVELGAKNLLFIKSSLVNTVEIAQRIYSTIRCSKIQETRFLLRLMPIEITCKAYVNDIKDAVKPLIDKHFVDSPKLFAITFNHRNNNTLVRDEVITAVAEIIAATRNDHKVNLKEPEVSINIEIVKNIALLAVIPNAMQYKKFNLQMDSNLSNNAEQVQ